MGIHSGCGLRPIRPGCGRPCLCDPAADRGKPRVTGRFTAHRDLRRRCCGCRDLSTDRIDSPADVWSQSTGGWIHSLTALVSYLGAIVGMLVLTWTFAHYPRWRSLIVWLSLLAGAALALLFVQSEGPWVGIMQRLLITAISGWLILVALRVRTIASEQGTAGAREALKSAAG